MTMTQSEAAIHQLMLDDPAEYERLLQSYWLMLGQKKLWWERVSDAGDPTWPSAVRSAIIAVARACDLEPHKLAVYLDLADMPISRAHVLSVARAIRGRMV